MSSMSVDFPEPDTPVIATKSPSGISTSTLRRLCSRALWMRIVFRGSTCRRSSGIAIFISPLRYLPVIDCGERANLVDGALGDHLAAVLAGTGSHVDDVVGGAHRLSSCSTTMTVLPRSRSCSSVARSRALSRWCRPIDGSSRMYSTPTSREPICCREPDALRLAAGERLGGADRA
jgi:hypothetical protein